MMKKIVLVLIVGLLGVCLMFLNKNVVGIY